MQVDGADDGGGGGGEAERESETGVGGSAPPVAKAGGGRPVNTCSKLRSLSPYSSITLADNYNKRFVSMFEWNN